MAVNYRKDRLDKFREKVQKATGVRERFRKTLKTKSEELVRIDMDLKNAEIAQTIIQAVARQTQSVLEYKISEMSSLALETIFDDPYSFHVEFTDFGGKRTECQMYFERDDYAFDPRNECGGGVEDVAEFSLRPAAWMIGTVKSRNVLLADEPFIRLKGEEANLRALQLLRRVSHDLNLQIIMVSDERVDRDLLLENTDKLFHVQKDGRYSVVEDFG
jgi:DNA repair exonuclease SbcCD ATPase subunit